MGGGEPREVGSGQIIKGIKSPVRKGLDISLIPDKAAEE